MPGQNLATYLNDHLAGSVAALELLERLEADHAGTELQRFFSTLRADIADDQAALKGLMDRLGITASPVRRAAAWVAEKAVRVKLGLDGAGDLRMLEATEAVAVGIEGKRSLWAALAEASEVVAELRGPDYATLGRRAAEQRQRIEPVRLGAARAALARGDGP